MRECSSHHYACDCREAAFRELLDAAISACVGIAEAYRDFPIERDCGEGAARDCAEAIRELRDRVWTPSQSDPTDPDAGPDPA